MSELKQWLGAIRARLGSVLPAVGACAAVFGFDFSPAEQATAIEGVDAIVAQGAAAVAAVNVFIEKMKASWKADPDIDTGPTTPGPLTPTE